MWSFKSCSKLLSLIRGLKICESGRDLLRVHSESLSGIKIRAATMTSVTNGSDDHVLEMKNINPCIKRMEYAIRGPLEIRASEIENELQNGVQKPFKEVIKANIGDAQAMGQPPITFIREVLAMVACPSLLETWDVPEDAKAKARLILNGCRGKSAGCYTEGNGIAFIRKHAAEFITRRDGGIPANPDDIVLSTGASDAIRSTLKLFIARDGQKRPGVMIPIPQYPLYSASLAEFDIEQVGYYLNEDTNWGLEISELERSLKEAQKTTDVRAIVVINPGNPTGQVLSRKNIEEIIKFAYKNKLFIFADEVYQDNVYAEGCAFHSFKKVLRELESPFNSAELTSFFSISKGYMGECGLRGGYQEIINIHPEVRRMLYKSITAKSCANVFGQAVMDCIVDPPRAGDASYPLFIKEKTAILASLTSRAKIVSETFNSFEGFSCSTVQGAMYAFPQIQLPPKAIEAAKAKNLVPDVFYALELLDNTGVCVVPGSGFGQKPGTFHFRTTILPPPDKLAILLEKFRDFHRKFMEKYA